MSKNISVRSFDVILRLGLQDGTLSEIEDQIVEIPGSGGITFKISQFLNNRFQELKELLGEKLFEKIVEEHGFVIPKAQFDSWTGGTDLDLHYLFHSPNKADYLSLVIISHGEKQPMRYMTHVEGIWELEGPDIHQLTV